MGDEDRQEGQTGQVQLQIPVQGRMHVAWGMEGVSCMYYRTFHSH
jgi:hypothetical protein